MIQVFFVHLHAGFLHNKWFRFGLLVIISRLWDADFQRKRKQEASADCFEWESLGSSSHRCASGQGLFFLTPSAFNAFSLTFVFLSHTLESCLTGVLADGRFPYKSINTSLPRPPPPQQPHGEICTPAKTRCD